MIVHSQIFDVKSKRSMADFTISLHTSPVVNYEDMAQNCEQLFAKLSEFDFIAKPTLLSKQYNAVVFNFGMVVPQRPEFYLISCL
mmetsp:Transcript_4368/g.7380  ORF Transcript_4368/g.7380 Transcript_4368/m.7380 type:complete len:85 (+) Transcript_4368:34-288(+)